MDEIGLALAIAWVVDRKRIHRPKLIRVHQQDPLVAFHLSKEVLLLVVVGRGYRVGHSHQEQVGGQLPKPSLTLHPGRQIPVETLEIGQDLFPDPFDQGLLEIETCLLYTSPSPRDS